MPVKLIPTDPDQVRLSEKPLLSDDAKFAAGKIVFFQYICVIIVLFLLSGFWRLQVQDPEFYFERAERNRIRTVPIPGPRGKILDRDGRVIVDNHSSFSLILSRVNLKQAHLRTICAGLDLDCDDLADRLKRYERRPKYEPIVIKEELTPGQIAFVEAHRGQDTFPEMELIHEPRRLYPRDGFAAHVIGYTGEVSEDELNTTEFARYKQGDVIGKAGIERFYNDTLIGVDGQRRVVVDNMGRVRKVIDKKEEVPGKSLTLTIDLDLQAVAELAMENRRGAVVALDPRTGEVLAMVSRPAYDPNRFAGRIRSREWRDLINDPGKPLLNRASQAQFAPGSTFKPFVALAGLEAGVIDDSFRASCGGSANFYGRAFKCHLARGHGGGVDLVRGLAQSCDVYFYNVGNRTGVDKIAEVAERSGFGSKTGIDLPGEAEGLVPSTRWKIRHFRQKWYAGETISVSIGQGAVTATPLQLAYAVGGIAMSGTWHRPHLVRNPGKPEEPRRAELDPEFVTGILDGMSAAVNGGGTAGSARLSGLELAGKTGTAQLVSNEFLRSRRQGQSVPDEFLKDNAWFVGFAPRTNPEIVVAALFENGEHGPAAAPIVRDVVKAYFDKKARRQVTISSATAPAAAPATPASPSPVP